MKQMTLLRAIAVAVTPAFALAPTGVFAAHAGAPYTNVDHSNDMGNDTGDSQVEGLNSSQLNENYHGPLQMRAPANPAHVAPPVSQVPAVPAPSVQTPAAPPP